MENIVQSTDNLNIESMVPLISPMELKEKYPLFLPLEKTVVQSRKEVNDIINQTDSRFMLITGPCSIHDEKSAFEYAKRLKKLSDEVKDKILIVMRVYFEKPRTTIGWKGLISDPHLNGSCDINFGLEKARHILSEIVGIGLPTATEILDPITPQFISDLISWVAIGARTTESQTHREMASGLSAAVGFKNGTSGNLGVAINAMESSSHPHSFLGIDQTGQTRIVQTTGNKLGHLVLRGGDNQPNYDAKSVLEAIESLSERKMKTSVIIDCSHDNSNKDHAKQPSVLEEIVVQKKAGQKAIVGAMLESHLEEGNQKMPADLSQLQYGVSITDKCINWATTEKCIRHVYSELPKY